MQDIRKLGEPLFHVEDDCSHPGYRYCMCFTQDGRIHVASKSDFVVLGSFPSLHTATKTMERLYWLEAAAHQAA